MKKLGVSLRRHREAARLTQEEVASKAGVRTKKVARIEIGIIEEADFMSVVLIGKALGLSPATLAELAGIEGES